MCISHVFNKEFTYVLTYFNSSSTKYFQLSEFLKWMMNSYTQGPEQLKVQALLDKY